MSFTVEPVSIPLAADKDGVMRVGGTRVTLDTVIAAFREGATAEEIVQEYPSFNSLTSIGSSATFCSTSPKSMPTSWTGSAARQHCKHRMKHSLTRLASVIGCSRVVLSNSHNQMLRLAADENFNYKIVRGLLRRDPTLDIVRVQDVGLSGADDPTVLAWAAQEQRVVLTQGR